MHAFETFHISSVLKSNLCVRKCVKIATKKAKRQPKTQKTSWSRLNQNISQKKNPKMPHFWGFWFPTGYFPPVVILFKNPKEKNRLDTQINVWSPFDPTFVVRRHTYHNLSNLAFLFLEHPWSKNTGQWRSPPPSPNSEPLKNTLSSYIFLRHIFADQLKYWKMSTFFSKINSSKIPSELNLSFWRRKSTAQSLMY